MINRRNILKSIPLIFFPARLFAQDLPHNVFGIAETFTEVKLDDRNFQHSFIVNNCAFYVQRCTYYCITKNGTLIRDEIRPTAMCDYIINKRLRTTSIPLYKQPDINLLEKDMEKMIDCGEDGRRFIVKYKNLVGLIIISKEDII